MTDNSRYQPTLTEDGQGTPDKPYVHPDAPTNLPDLYADTLWRWAPDRITNAQHKLNQTDSANQSAIKEIAAGFRSDAPFGENVVRFLQAVTRSQYSRTYAVELPRTGAPTNSAGHRLLEGHGWLTNLYGLDDTALNWLLDNGFIERPRMNGEPREKIGKRRYWSPTPKARWLTPMQSSAFVLTPDGTFEYSLTGPGKADSIGEKVVHKVGVRAAAAWLQYNLGISGSEFPAYDSLALNEIQLPKDWQGSPTATFDVGVADAGEPQLAVEVKTTVEGGGRNIVGRDDRFSSADRMQAVAGQPTKVWIAANQSVAADLINTLREHDYLTFPAQIGPMTTHSIGTMNAYLTRNETRSDTIDRLDTLEGLLRKLRTTDATTGLLQSDVPDGVTLTSSPR
ncbi:hypothetical protein [Halorussus salinus]|uniref:hypothetical protein n=1 Tax=Halorussus salinus TaxID=1364935 RepID=UPI0010928164|nr:hypothetical protein [Halorussus salinus]